MKSLDNKSFKKIQFITHVK